MADISTKMQVTGISQYKSAMTQAQQSVKTLDAELKKNEAAYKASGDKEKYMADQAKTLEQKIKAQKNAVKQAEAALKAMKDQGVDPASTSYQKMQQALLQAQAGVLETTSALNNLNQSEQTAASGADQLTASVNGINKKVSFDQVIGGIDKITSGLESAAKKAFDVGQEIWNNILNSARLADDIGTAAQLLDMDVEEYQRYKGVFDTIAEMTVADWQKAKRKVQQAIYDPSSDQVDVMTALGISPTTQTGTGKYGAVEVAKDWETVFWEAGAELQRRVKNGSISQDQADVYANALFGKSYANLGVLLDMGEEKFKAALEEQNVASQEAIEKDAALNDAVIKLTESYEALKLEFTSGLAPALTDAATALDGLLGKLLEYLKSEDGQKMLEDLGTAVSGLFEDLGEIEPDKVIEGFVGVFNGIKDTLEWLVNNKGTVEGLLIGIAGAWSAAKLTGGALQVLNLINGIKGLSGAGAVSAAASAGTSIGTSWGGAFAAAVLAVAPWLLAILAKNVIPEENQVDNSKRVESADTNAEEVQRLIKWVELQNEVAKLAEKYGTEDFDEQKYNDLWSEIDKLGKVQEGDLWSKYWDYLVSNDLMGGEMPTDFLQKMLDDLTSGEPVEVPTEPKVDVDAAQEELNNAGLTVPVTPQVNWGGFWGSGGGGGGGRFNVTMGRANGLPFVPFDGYPAILHKGERVLTASANQNYTYNSNTYFGNVNLNNGLEIDALSESIARHNKKQRAGYGY